MLQPQTMLLPPPTMMPLLLLLMVVVVVVMCLSDTFEWPASIFKGSLSFKAAASEPSSLPAVPAISVAAALLLLLLLLMQLEGAPPADGSTSSPALLPCSARKSCGVNHTLHTWMEQRASHPASHSHALPPASWTAWKPQ